VKGEDSEGSNEGSTKEGSSGRPLGKGLGDARYDSVGNVKLGSSTE